jgi:surfeit locus 1 family protein
MPQLNLDSTVLIQTLEDMEYRSVVARGKYDYQDQIALTNQVWQDLPGVHLITPLQVEGSPFAVLVDRGWIPLADASPENWDKYDDQGIVEVKGVIRRSTTKPEIGNKTDPIPGPGEPGLKEWNLLNVERIDQQIAGELLPVYIQQGQDEGRTYPPYPAAAPVELSDGPHLGYAAQWFMFALILGLGYPILLHRRHGAQRSGEAEYVRRSKNA